MNRIKQLIEELCPDGVEFKELGEVCEFIKGKFLSKDDKGLGDTPIILYGELYTQYGDYIKEIVSFTSKNKVAKSPIIENGSLLLPISSTTKEAQIGKVSAFMMKANVYLGSDALMLKHNQIPGYLVHLLNSSWFEKFKMQCVFGTTINHLHPSKFAKISIPLPPLPIQQEIVTILDTFTALDASLQAELEVRRKQYEHYRNQLLNFEGKEVEWKTLGEIGKVCMCKRVMKHETKSVGDIPFYKIGTFGKEADAFISKELFEEYVSRFSFPKKGDILISASGTIGRRVIYDAKPAYFQDSNIVWLSNYEKVILNKYLYYVYETIEWPVEGGTIKRLYNDNFKKIKIPIPSLSEQERIVGILDKFDALVSSTGSATGGLPAEIDARRKQYEYYREKLLTFEPK